MRLYVSRITEDAEGLKPATFEFRNTIEEAWYWQTRDAANRASELLSVVGIDINPPNGFKHKASCSAFRVEPLPQGGFAISCEVPSLCS
jgi:hypothetical protein